MYIKIFQQGSTFTKREGGNQISSRVNHSGKDIEAVITRVRGVISSRAVYEGGEIVEIHVLANGTRSAKQVVRDIESALLLKLGLEVDHKRISVAQLGQDLPLPAGGAPRLQLQRINYSAGNGEATVTIIVALEGNAYEASVSGPGFKKNRLRLAAQATLAAVERYLGGAAKCLVADVQKISIAGETVVVALVNLCLASGEETLLGAVLDRGDDLEAAARSILDAVNRRIGIINGV